MRTTLAILVVLIAPVLLSGCEFCRKKKAAPAEPGAEATAVEKGMAGAEGEAAGAPVATPPKLKSWGEEYADFVGWHDGASARHHRMPAAVEVEVEIEVEVEEVPEEDGESHEGGEEDHDEMGNGE